jgi:hypothetical protein
VKLNFINSSCHQSDEVIFGSYSNTSDLDFGIDTNDKETTVDSSEELVALKKLLADEKKKNERLQTKYDTLESQVDELSRFRNVLIGVCKTLQDNGENIMEYLSPIIREKNEMYGEDHTHVIDDVLQEIE